MTQRESLFYFEQRIANNKSAGLEFTAANDGEALMVLLDTVLEHEKFKERLTPKAVIKKDIQKGYCSIDAQLLTCPNCGGAMMYEEDEVEEDTDE